MERSEKTSSAAKKFDLDHLASCPEQLLPVFSLEFRRASHRATDGEVAQSVSSSPGFLPYYHNITEGILGTLGPNDIIGLHNVLRNDVRDLVERLNAHLVQGEDKWAYTGAGRRKDEPSFVYSPILYRPSKWQRLDLTVSCGAATPELGPPSQDNLHRTAFTQSYLTDALRRTAYTQSYLIHRQTGACITAVNNYFSRINTAGAFQLVAPVLGEPSAMSTRNRLLEIREESCSKVSAEGTEFENMQDICQYLTDYFIPFYDSIVAKPLDEERAELGAFSQSDGSQHDILDRIPSLKQDHKTAEIVKGVAHGFHQDVCYAKDSPFLSPHSFELLANTSDLGICRPHEQPAAADMDLRIEPASWQLTLPTLADFVSGLIVAFLIQSVFRQLASVIRRVFRYLFPRHA